MSLIIFNAYHQELLDHISSIHIQTFFVIILSWSTSKNLAELVFVMRQMCISYLTFSDVMAHVILTS